MPVFGPSQAAARLESSKSFARQIMSSAGVPSPVYRVFHESGPAVDYVQSVGAPVVVKADGLAAGKGAVVCSTVEDACLVVRDCMEQGVFGPAGSTVVIEECLSGFEVSLFAFCDGEHLSNPVAAGDYKRAGDGDLGPNTGGMGSITPPTGWSTADSAMAMDLVMRPTVDAMAERGTPLPGRSVRRADGHRIRPQGAGVQLPVRGPRDPGHPSAAGQRPHRGDDGVCRREIGGIARGMVSGGPGGGGDGIRRVPGPL